MQLRPIWTLLCDGGGIEGGTLELHGKRSSKERLSGLVGFNMQFPGISGNDGVGATPEMTSSVATYTYVLMYTHIDFSVHATIIMYGKSCS